MQPRGWGFLVGIAVLLLINLASATFLLPAGPQRVDIPYTLFKQQVDAANVAEIASRGDTIQGTFRQPVTVPSSNPGASGPQRDRLRDRHASVRRPWTGNAA